jgi:hypothetical protein
MDNNEKIIPEPEPDFEAEAMAPPAPPTSNEFIDNLTLELFMNKNHYNRYISQKNPKKFSELQEYLENIDIHKESILEITNELLDDPQKQLTTKITDLFQEYTKTLIEYINDKKRQEQQEYEYNDKKEDIMFSNMDEPSSHQSSKSFWSKEKIIRKSMNMFSNNRKF